MKDFTVQHNLSFSVKKLMWMLMNAQNNKYSDRNHQVNGI